MLQEQPFLKRKKKQYKLTIIQQTEKFGNNAFDDKLSKVRYVSARHRRVVLSVVIKPIQKRQIINRIITNN